MEDESFEGGDQAGALGFEVGDDLGALGAVLSLRGGQAFLGVLEQLLEHVAPHVGVRLERGHLVGRRFARCGCLRVPGDLCAGRLGNVGCVFLGGSVGHRCSIDGLRRL